jgi:hypothetical protein
MRWHLSGTRPADWAHALEACGGSFFHAPPALDVSLPAGAPIYARLLRGEQTIAVALGAAARCRLGTGATHVTFAAPPAVAAWAVVPEEAAAAMLVRELRTSAAAAEVDMGSFAAAAPLGPSAGGMPSRERLEAVVPLGPDGAAPEDVGRTHRRHAAAGDREGWELRRVAGAAAVDLLHRVQREAARRADERGEPFPAPEPPSCVGVGDPTDAPWGLSLFASYGEGGALAAALVGWANRRAFYLMGGSTPEGYTRSAAPWLHLAVMRRLGSAGMTEYDMGGVPAPAADPAHPSNGLYRFKLGFGARVVPCRGMRWETARLHLGIHRVFRGIQSLSGALR